MTISILGLSGSARATPNFPAALADDLALTSTPDCSLCHTDGDQGGTGTVNTPFGKSMRARGLVAYDTSSLSAALALMEAENVDSAGACLSDVAELQAGRDPNAKADLADCDGGGGGAVSESASSVELPSYGCNLAAPRGLARPASSPWRAPLFLLLTAALVFIRRNVRGSKSALVLAMAVLSLSGCTHVQPYERGMLAHPTMTTSPVDGTGIQHVYSVQEGAIGGGAAAEGGCGCN